MTSADRSPLAELRLEDFLGTSRLMLFDLEFTCWEGSLVSGWADASRPAEVIEIGLAAFDRDRNEILGTFRSYVRPRMNPRLSEYCINLLHISQRDIDDAPSLPDAVTRMRAWEAALSFGDTPTCAWGRFDRVFLAEDVRRTGCEDPFDGRPHADLARLVGIRAGLPGPLYDREELRARIGLEPCPDRHAALADALDLRQFCQWLETRGVTRRGRGVSPIDSDRIAP